MKDLLFNKAFMVEVGDSKEIISHEGIAEINEWLYSKRLERFDWNPEWIGAQGRFTGTFPKRVAKFQKYYNRAMTDQEVSELGNLARKYIIASGKYKIVIDNTFDWKMGTFGDHNSCFWQSRHLAKNMLVDHGANSVRVYFQSNDEPVARCWIAPWENSVIIFNAYSTRQTFYLKDIASLLTRTIPHSTFTEVKLVNWKYGGEGTLFINGEQGIIIHSENEEQEDYIDLQWTDPVLSVEQCNDCNDWTYTRILYNTRYNTIVCPECLHQKYVVCEICGNYILREKAVYKNGCYYDAELFAEKQQELEKSKILTGIIDRREIRFRFEEGPFPIYTWPEPRPVDDLPEDLEF